MATYGVLPAANIPPPYALASISAVQFDYYGQRFATAALDGTVCTWQVEVGGRSNVHPTESSLCFNTHASYVKQTFWMEWSLLDRAPNLTSLFLLITGMSHFWLQVDQFLLQLDAVQMVQMLLFGIHWCHHPLVKLLLCVMKVFHWLMLCSIWNYNHENNAYGC